MKKLHIVQGFKALVFILLCFFVGMNLNVPRISDKEFGNVQNLTLQNFDLKDYKQMSNQEIKRFLNVNPQDYERISFKRINDPMQADEIVIVQFKLVEQGQEFKDKMEERMENQKNIYDGYAPEEAKLVDKGIINLQANYALYVVGDSAQEINKAFVKSLK